jgi:hypothetical protein
MLNVGEHGVADDDHLPIKNKSTVASAKCLFQQATGGNFRQYCVLMDFELFMGVLRETKRARDDNERQQGDEAKRKFNFDTKA